MYITFFYLFFFFFSSRRRHTRYWRDWSSDVCSSDLGEESKGHDDEPQPAQATELVLRDRESDRRARQEQEPEERSEERRVGKECRYRWSPKHEKKKEQSGRGIE